MPAESPEVLTDAVRVLLPVPEDGLNDSQAAVSVALQLSVPLPEFVMAMF